MFRKIGCSTKTSPDFSFKDGSEERRGLVEKFSPRKELFGFMLRWFGQVFPPWSDHPTPFGRKTVRVSKLWKRGKFRTSCNVSFCTWFWIWPAFEESFVTWTPRRRRRRRPAEDRWRKLKICKFSLVSLLEESLSSVLLLFWLAILARDRSCEGEENSMFLASKLVRFCEQFPGWFCFEQWRLLG